MTQAQERGTQPDSSSTSLGGSGLSGPHAREAVHRACLPPLGLHPGEHAAEQGWARCTAPSLSLEAAASLLWFLLEDSKRALRSLGAQEPRAIL